MCVLSSVFVVVSVVCGRGDISKSDTMTVNFLESRFHCELQSSTNHACVHVYDMSHDDGYDVVVGLFCVFSY